jgi:hypothetical protein
MRRREFILGLAMLADVGRASAQGRARRVGVLGTDPGTPTVLETILKEKGWIVGRNLQIEYRLTRGDTHLSRAYARELIAWQPDVLFVATNTSMAALYAEHSNIPTVFTWVRGVPRSLKPKLGFLRKCLKTLPVLAEFRDEGVCLLSHVLSASERRHGLIHSAITELRPDPATGAFRFRRIGYDGDLHTISEFTITPNDFRAFAPILTDLVTHSIAFSQRLGDKFLGS